MLNILEEQDKYTIIHETVKNKDFEKSDTGIEDI